MPYFAKVKNGIVISAYEFSDAAHGWCQAVDDDEIIVQLTNREFGMWMESRSASYDKLLVPIKREPALDDKKRARLMQLDRDTTEFIYSRFPKHKQDDFSWLLLLAVSEGKSDIAAKIKTLFQWIGSVLNYHYQIKEAIEGATSESVLETIEYDFDLFSNAPEIKLKDIIRRFNGNEAKQGVLRT